MRNRYYLFLSLLVVAGLSISLLPQYLATQVKFSDGTFLQAKVDSQCEDVVMKAAAVSVTITQTTAANGVWQVIQFNDFVQTISVDATGSWSQGTETHEIEMCFAPPDEVGADLICDFTMNTAFDNNAFHQVQMAFDPISPIEADDIVAFANWIGPDGSNVWQNFSQKSTMTIQNNGCIGLTFMQIGVSGTLSMSDYALECHQVNTTAFPCHQ